MKMGLWIRSQDKTTLIRSYEIYISEQQNTYLIRAKRTSHILGSYSTIGRAIEVLDEIQNIIYINKLFNADINAFQKSLKIEEYTEKEIAQALKTISTYEMPKE